MKQLVDAPDAESSEKATLQHADLEAPEMGMVLVTLKVMPDGVESNLDDIAEALKNLGVGKFNSIEKEPIAFGLMALKPSYVVEDTGGVSDLLEEKIGEISGVKTAEVVDATLV
jgi:translation elongation factor aEF-1 beta